MTITLNGKTKEFDNKLTVTELINKVSSTNKRVIAEINGAIIKQNQWDNTMINDGDAIELVTFVGGG
ncbi:MAG: sulfur carrier protein [Lysobacterales bacterium]|jgi:sulfur carrier protein